MVSEQSQKNTRRNAIDSTLEALQRVRDVLTEHDIQIERIGDISGDVVDVSGEVYLTLRVRVPVGAVPERSSES
jgi:hypothetical protein